MGEPVFEPALLRRMRLFFGEGVHAVPDNRDNAKQRCHHTPCQCAVGFWRPSNNVGLGERSPSV